MIFLLFILGVVLVGVSGRLVAQAIVLPKLQLKNHLREIQDYGFRQRSPVEEVSSRVKRKEAIRRFAERAGRFTMAHAPALTPLKRGNLTAAGFYDVTTETVHGYRALAMIGVPSLVLFFLLASGGGLSLVTLVLLVAAAIAGWQLPAVLIKSRGAARLADMDRQLPELIDLLIATVEAGLGFGASIGMIAHRFTGGLGDELRLTLKQQSLGISNEQALSDMAERCDTPSIRAFVRTVNRGQSLGVSIGPILRELAVDMRRRRRQTAHEKMQKAPVKMMFPLMFLIMPPLMMVIGYPAAYSVFSTFSGH
jgi:tight adherence protein C